MSGALGTQGFNSTEVNLSTMSHPPLRASGKSYSHSTSKSPPPSAISADIEHTTGNIRCTETLFLSGNTYSQSQNLFAQTTLF